MVLAGDVLWENGALGLGLRLRLKEGSPLLLCAPVRFFGESWTKKARAAAQVLTISLLGAYIAIEFLTIDGQTIQFI